MHIIVGDLVQIIKGKDRPQTAEDRKQPSGKVLKVDRAKGRVIVEGKNLVWKHLLAPLKIAKPRPSRKAKT